MLGMSGKNVQDVYKMCCNVEVYERLITLWEWHQGRNFS